LTIEKLDVIFIEMVCYGDNDGAVASQKLDRILKGSWTPIENQ